MKIKNLILANFAAFGIASLAHAQQTVVITGSTAYRGAVDTAIQQLGFTPVTTITGKTSNDGDAATYTANSGTYSGWTVKTSWSGSAAGIQKVAATSPIMTVGVFADGVTGPQPTDPRSGVNQVRPDIAFSDNTQASTKFNGTYYGTTYTTLSKALITSNGPETPDQGRVGVVPFVFALSRSANGTFANDTLNMTSQAAQSIWGTVGSGPLALLTGNSSDQNTTLFATGRDPDSGTRIVTFAETGIGINSVVTQFRGGASGGNFTSLAPYSAGTVNGLPVGLGQSGESSGSSLATMMSNFGPSTAVAADAGGYAGYLVGYMGTSDFNRITGGVRLLYNGVPYTDANVREGRYTLWGYVYCQYRPDASNNIKSFANALASRIYNTTATIRIPTMQVSRSQDGGVVTPNY